MDNSKALTPKQQFAGALDTMIPHCQKAFTPAAERIIRCAQNALMIRPKLLDCNLTSLKVAVVQCVQYGLEPDSPLQHCHLLPYKGQVKLVVGYRGLTDLAYRNSDIAMINTNVWRDGDKFVYKHTQNGAVLDHEENFDLDRTDSKLIKGAYTLIFLKGSTQPLIRLMTRDQIDAIMKRSPGFLHGGADSPWKTDYEAMAIKTILKQACKYIPLSVEKGERLAGAIQHDNAVEASEVSVDESKAAEVVAKIDRSVDPDFNVYPEEPEPQSPSRSAEMARKLSEGPADAKPTPTPPLEPPPAEKAATPPAEPKSKAFANEGEIDQAIAEKYAAYNKGDLIEQVSQWAREPITLRLCCDDIKRYNVIPQFTHVQKLGITDLRRFVASAAIWYRDNV